MIGPFVVVHKLFSKGMAIFANDGNKPCPQGILFLTHKDKPVTLFNKMEEAQRAVERTIDWGEEQAYGWGFEDYTIIPVSIYEEIQKRHTRGFKKKPKDKKKDE